MSEDMWSVWKLVRCISMHPMGLWDGFAMLRQNQAVSESRVSAHSESFTGAQRNRTERSQEADFKGLTCFWKESELFPRTIKVLVTQNVFLNSSARVPERQH